MKVQKNNIMFIDVFMLHKLQVSKSLEAVKYFQLTIQNDLRESQTTNSRYSLNWKLFLTLIILPRNFDLIIIQ